jgi:hypothetical protein
VIAALLLEATKIPTIAAAQNRQRPISMPVRRYENLLLQKVIINQTTNDNINIVDIDKL